MTWRDVACSVSKALSKRARTLRRWLQLRTADQLGPGWKLSRHHAEALLQVPFHVAVGTFWAFLEQQARDKHTADVMVVSYEALVRRPQYVAHHIALHTGVDAQQLCASAIRLMTDDPHGHVATASAGNHDAVGRTVRVGRWRTEFTPQELRQLDYLAGDFYRSLGYTDWEA